MQPASHLMVRRSDDSRARVVAIADRRAARDVPARIVLRPTGEQRIAAAFAAARAEGRAALMPFLMGAFPTLHASRQIASAYADAGADLIELGIPVADAHADGPVNRSAAATALQGGATVEGVLDVARALSARLPVIVMCYAQPVLARGITPFVAALRDAGVSGLIVPDLSPRHSAALLSACDKAAIALAPLLTPTTSHGDAARIGARARGFVYTVAVTGTTGERPALPVDSAALIQRAKDHTAAPVALGFGISTPLHAAQAAAAGADGVIVGSRLVRAAAEATDPAAAVHALVSQLAAALRAPAAHRPTPPPATARPRVAHAAPTTLAA